ncbi:maltase-glucoamylase-like, partial [Diadema antillarum]|uniref:maltase-glucoamylase-like n=1 Tax=Diadema antillarum TaxID=105358 RepID=UPI003A86EF1A
MANKMVVSIILVMIGALVACGIGLGVYFGVDWTEETVVDDDEPPVDGLNRFDCYPEPGGSQAACERRECIWQETDVEGAPWCYYPSNFGYVMYEDPTRTELGWRVRLARRRQAHRYDVPSDNIELTVEIQTDSRLHFKITDAFTDRFEVPLEVEIPSERAANPQYEVSYTRNPFSLQITRVSTGTVIFDTSVGGMTFEEQFLQISTLLPSSNLYGFGEHNHRRFKLDLNWKTWAIFTRDVAPIDPWNLYGHHPFYMCVEEDGNAHGVFLLNSNAMDIVLQPTPGLTYRTIGGVLDFYVFLGPTPENVIGQYGEIIGRPVMIPYWALGFQLSRWNYTTLDRVKEVWSEMVEAGIPYDVQYGDIDYMDGQKDFTYDNVTYYGLPGFVDQLHAHGQRYIIILDHCIKKEVGYHAYDRGLNPNVFVLDPAGEEPIVGNVWPGDSVYPDFTNPNAQAWWTDLCAEFHDVIPYDALWIDMNEPSNFIPGSIDGCRENQWNYPPYMPNVLIDEGQIFTKTLCMDAQHYGGAHYDQHSLYGHTMSEMTFQTLKTVFPDKRSMALTRSSFAGTGKYAQHWLGDNQSFWEQIWWSIVGMFEFNMFGFPYIGADICGFWFNTTEEMCWRWMQVGAFYPYARNHNGDGMIPQHPTAFSVEMADMSRDILLHRYRLLPFLYTLFYEAHASSATVVRPLLNEFTMDKNTYDIDRQFLWGPCFMISPVLEKGETTVEVYFPNARWYDYYTGQEMVEERGELSILLAPMEVINLHVRGGYIIPTQHPANTTVYSRLNPLGLIVALDDNNEANGTLFWDDGEKRDSYENGEYSLLTFTAAEGVLSATIEMAGFIDPNNLYFDNVSIYGTSFVNRTDIEITSGTDMIDTFDFDYNENIKNLGLRLTMEWTTTNKIILTVVTAAVVLAIGLGVGLSGLNVSTDYDFDVVPLDADRYDCLPDGPDPFDAGEAESMCLQRGCKWRETETPEVPWCYYPSDYGYQMVGDPTESEEGISVLLERLDTPERYGGAAQTLRFVVQFMENTIRFKITDANAKRWEVPLDTSEWSYHVPYGHDYEVQFRRSPFGLVILRLSTNTPIFDSTVGGLTFEDQFIQISSRLPSSNVYGFGEHNHRRFKLDLNYKTWAIFTRDVAPVDEWNLYGAHPFHLCLEDNGDASGVFLLNSNAMDIVLQPTPAVTYRTIGGVLDFFVFIGPTPEAVIQQYLNVIGRPVMVPYWSLGFQLSRWDYGSLDRVKEVWSEMVAAGIPYDVQYGDIDYMDGKKDFTYDNDTYNGLPEFVDMLHDYGQRYIIILDHGIKVEEGYHAYDRGLEPNVYVLNSAGTAPIVGEVWPGDSVYPDFTNPDCLEWWTRLCEEFHEEIAYDALWIDMNEPSNFIWGSVTGCSDSPLNYPPYLPRLLMEMTGNIYDKTICMDAITAMGLQYDVHSLYGHSMSEATYRTLQQVFPDKRSLVLTRSSFAGTGRYAQHWLGDNQSQWPQMSWSIVGMLEFNMFGFPYIGADICGFWYNTTYEMCWRWTQLGAFYPYARNHNAEGWHPQHPTAFDETFAERTRDILLVRYQLLPYLYSLFFDATFYGKTVVRPLMFEFPRDNMTYDIDRQFLWGPAFMISPALEEGQTTVDVYFPTDARWYDYYNGSEISMNTDYITLPSPMELINLHVRGGYILPRQEPSNTTKYSRLNPLGLLVAMDTNQEAEGFLYWDDGESRDLDAHTKIWFQAQGGAIRSTIERAAYDDPNDLYFNEVIVYGIENYDSDYGVYLDDTKLESGVDFDSNLNVYMELGVKILVTFITVVVLIGIGLGIGLSSLYYDPGDNLVVIPFEPIPEPALRFDCYPEEGASQESCLTRGCYWAETDEQGAPWCYFPKERDVPGYRMVGDPEGTRLGWKVLLQRLDTPVRFDGAVQTLELQVEMHTPQRLRFKLTDSDNDRYEVPTIEVEDPAEKPDVTEYEISYIREPFSLQIIRVSTREVIFDTSVGVLIYEDQFLQISTRLPSSNLYGFGEHNHRRFRHDLNWKTWGIFTRDIGDPVNLYGAHPFHMVIEDDGNAHGVFFVNSNAMEVVLQPTPAVTYRTIGGVLDFHVILGPTPENVISQYGEIIGRPVMVPYWSLGFQLCRWNYTTLDRVKQVWSDMIEAQIPYDVQYGDIDYMDKQKDFTYDRDGAYAGLPEFVQQVHDHGQRYIIILDHAIKKEPGYHAYDRGLDPNAYVLAPNRSMPIVGNVWPGDSVYPDFFNPNAVDYWTNLTQDFHKEIEFDALWIDMNEPSNFVRGSVDECDINRWNYPPYIPKLLIEENKIFTKTICMDSHHYTGDHYNLHSLYGHSMSQVTHESLKSVFPSKRSLVFSRSTFAGTGKYAHHWLGDNHSLWEHLWWSIVGMLEFNMFGMPYIGADICGFSYNTTYELCWRWTQLGAFYPYARNHNAHGWAPQHPPVFGDEFVAMTKNILEERYRLLPFLYTIFYHAHLDSATVVRPLANEFPTDPVALDIDRQFLWGPCLMISPVLEEGETSIDAYFPDARWFDYFTGEEMRNERGHLSYLYTPMEKINVHVRGGHIIPRQEPANTTVYSRLKPLSVLVALDDNMEAMGDFFWDDGELRDSYEKGEYSLLKFAASQGTLTMSIEVTGYTDPNQLTFEHV